MRLVATKENTEITKDVVRVHEVLIAITPT